ncbi:MAG: HAMP domain-containing histidine kinase [Acidimicrobiales bacterium]|nr:HAMP domain-containing histidine kinase [Acidimicrobiales bacterium]
MGLGARLATGFAVVAVATALVVGGASYITTGRQVTAEIDQFLEQRADEIADGRRDKPRDRRDRQSDNPVVVSVSPDAEVQILDGDGDVVSNTGLLLPVDDTERELADENRRAVLRTITIDGTDYRMITDHLDGGGAIQVARSLEESESLLDVLRTRTLATAGIVAVLAASAGWVLAQRTTRPLRTLSNTVDEVAETRDFAVTVPTTGRDEVGRLGDGFNRMLRALQRSQQQQHQLVQDAAHELRTPLTSVTANIDWLMRAPELEPDARHATLAGVRRELAELNNVMAEIIELATDSHQPPATVPVDLAAVVYTAVDRFVHRTGRNVTTTTSPVVVLGDADSLDRAVTNLLTNADKYSPAGSTIAVEVGPDGVFIDDAGPGIPVSERDRVFDRFYRRDQDRPMPGSGLGLSIVASIVEQHGGDVAVTESPLGGARVGFRLPPAGPI